MARANQIRVLGTFEYHDEASRALSTPGDAALVHRGVPRGLLVRCPCGCGETLVINLDRRAGKAWRMYERAKSVSLYPSYWRDTGCGSHFIIWGNHIYWCDWEDLYPPSDAPGEVEARVLRVLTEHFAPYEGIADHIGEIPWAVLLACRSLVSKGLAVEKGPRRAGEFRRRE